MLNPMDPAPNQAIMINPFTSRVDQAIVAFLSSAVHLIAASAPTILMEVQQSHVLPMVHCTQLARRDSDPPVNPKQRRLAIEPNRETEKQEERNEEEQSTPPTPLPTLPLMLTPPAQTHPFALVQMPNQPDPDNHHRVQPTPKSFGNPAPDVPPQQRSGIHPALAAFLVESQERNQTHTKASAQLQDVPSQNGSAQNKALENIDCLLVFWDFYKQ